MKPYVHLHVHTVYSLLDGLNFIEPLVKHAKQMGFTALAITDHGRLSGALEFYLACKKHGIKPIIGCEVYLAHQSAQEPVGGGNPTDHLLLLCQNQTGYRNLCKLLTIADKPPYFSRRPRVDLELLARYSEGLICSSACILGPIGRHICEPQIYDYSRREYDTWTRDVKMAIAYAGALKEIFPGRFFLELMNHMSHEQDLLHMDPACRGSYEGAMRMEQAILDHAREVSSGAGVPWIATNDCHFLRPDLHRAHDVLVQINTKRTTKTGTKTKALRSGLQQLYLKSGDEMWALFGHEPDLLTNTLWIAEQCNLDFETGKFRIPKFEIPQTGHTANGPDEYMHMMALLGAQQRYDMPLSTEVMQRIKFEVETIAKIGVSDYMLIVADFVKEAKERGILVGPARGSAGGSVVSYCLGITDLDPLRHGLLFERFMNPDRVSMPDIDLDFPPHRVQEVIDYIVKKYGADKVARIATFQTLETKAAIQRVGIDIFEQERPEMFKLTKSLPDKQGFFSTPLRELRESHGPLVQWVGQDPTTRNDLLDVCEELVGVKQAASAHAAGIVLSDRPLTEYLPLMVGSSERKAKAFGDDILMHTQMPMDDLEEIGLLKIDLLGVDYLASIERCIQYIKERQGIDFKFLEEKDEPYDDAAALKLIQDGRTAGIFQVESETMRRVCMKLQPETFEQVYAILAIHRPGPMDTIDEETGMTMEETFIQRKRGMQEVSTLMPGIAKILEPTFGVLVYQEQIMLISRVICGYTPSEADYLRKGVGKKIPALVKKEREKFIPKAIERGHDPAAIQKLWDGIERFARYGFNKSHSVGYGKLTYYTAYLKAHFLLEWMAALLTIKADREKQVRKYVDECARMKIEIHGPDINLSKAEWVPEGEGIRFGLRSILGIDAAAQKLVELRGSVGFDSFKDCVDRCHAAKFKESDVATLIKAGACDMWGKRLAMLKALKDRWKILTKRHKKPEKVATLFSEVIDGLEEGRALSHDERQGDHLKLLSGCYDVEVETGDVTTNRLVVTSPDWNTTTSAVEITQRQAGATPVFLETPNMAGTKKVWLQIGKVRNTKSLRDELENAGCKIAL